MCVCVCSDPPSPKLQPPLPADWIDPATVDWSALTSLTTRGDDDGGPVDDGISNKERRYRFPTHRNCCRCLSTRESGSEVADSAEGGGRLAPSPKEAERMQRRAGPFGQWVPSPGKSSWLGSTPIPSLGVVASQLARMFFCPGLGLPCSPTDLHKCTRAP